MKRQSRNSLVIHEESKSVKLFRRRKKKNIITFWNVLPVRRYVLGYRKQSELYYLFYESSNLTGYCFQHAWKSTFQGPKDFKTLQVNCIGFY